jgi:hypothetical protein
MLIIGCDYHPGVQQIAFMDTETGEFGERRLDHHPNLLRNRLCNKREQNRFFANSIGVGSLMIT